MIIDIDQVEGNIAFGTRTQPKDTPEINTLDVIKAAFRTENTIGSILNNQTPITRPNDEYDPFNDIQGYEIYADNFLNADSLETVTKIKSQIDRENEDRKLIEESGSIGFMSSLAAGIIDPVNLIPVGGAATKAYTLGGSILKGAGTTAVAGLVGSTAAETILNSTQETRTLGESAVNIAGATVLSGILGGAAGLLGRDGIISAGKKFEDDMVIPKPDEVDIAEPNSIKFGSVGAAKVNDTTIAQETLSKAWGVEKVVAAMKLSPKIRLAVSPSVESRKYIQQLADTPFYYDKNAQGIANPISIESLIGLQEARIGTAVEQQKILYKEYRKRIAAEGQKPLSYLTFREEAAKASRRDDTHEIGEVQKLAGIYRKEVLDPLKEAGITAKLLPEDVKVKTASSYLHRWWDKQKVAAKRNELKEIIHNGLRSEYSAFQERSAKRIEKKTKNIQSEIDALSIASLRDEQNFVESQGGVTEQEILDAIRMLQTPPKKPETLMSFLQKKGGLKEYSGELKNIGITSKARPGFINNKKGMTLDDATLAAWQNGFFPQFRERPVIDDLLEAIREDYNGNLVVRQEDMQYASELERLSDIQRALDEMGIDIDKFKGVKSLGDFDLGVIKKNINDIQTTRRAAKIEDLSGKLKQVSLDVAVELSDDELAQIADDIIDNILGHSDARLPYDIPLAARGPLKERTLSFIKDIDVEQFLVNDIEAVAKKYVRTMAADIAIKEKFGDMNIVGGDGLITSKIRDDYKRLMAEAQTDAERLKLENQMKQDLEDIEAIVGQLRGTYGQPDNPDSTIVRVGRSVRELQYMSKLGGMTLSAFADVARPIMVHGFSKTFGDALLPLIRDFKTFKLLTKEVKESGAAWDMVVDSRTMSLAELNDPYVKGTKFEKGLTALSSGFGKITLMTQWNTALKQFSGVVTQGRIIAGVRSGNKIKPKDARYLAMIGIDAAMAKRIAGQLDKYGDTFKGTEVANAAKWTDLEAQMVFRAAIRKEVNRIIVEPGVGDLPLWMKGSEIGKMVGQFKSFSFASTNKVLISGLQEADAQKLSGWMLAVSMGMISYAFKTWDRGEELSDDPRVWIAEGIDRSGLLAIFGEVNQISNKFTRGAVSLQALAGAPPLTRYASSNAPGVLFGPTIGTVTDVAQITGSAANGEWTTSDSRALRRMIPYQNLMGARQLFDKFEEGINEIMGVR